MFLVPKHRLLQDISKPKCSFALSFLFSSLIDNHSIADHVTFEAIFATIQHVQITDLDHDDAARKQNGSHRAPVAEKIWRSAINLWCDETSSVGDGLLHTDRHGSFVVWCVVVDVPLKENWHGQNKQRRKLRQSWVTHRRRWFRAQCIVGRQSDSMQSI